MCIFTWLTQGLIGFWYDEWINGDILEVDGWVCVVCGLWVVP